MAPRKKLLTLLPILFCLSNLAAAEKPHPHLYFDQAGLLALRSRVQNNPRLAKLWRSFKKYRIDRQAMKVVVPPGPMTDDISEGRNYGNALAELTIAYIVTGEQRFVDKAREITLALAEKPTWGDQLVVAHIDIGLALCWDVMYDHFSTAERNQILKAVRANGKTHINSNQLSNHNWTPSAGHGLIGLAFAGDGGGGFNKDMRELVDGAKQNFKEDERSVLWAHGTDGFSPQGPGYWRKYNHLALFLHALRFNQPENDWFHLGKEYPGSEFLQNSAYPRIYGDVQHPDLAVISWNDAQVIGGSKPGPYGNISSLIFAASEYRDGYVMDFVDFMLFEADVRVEEEDAAGFILFNDENIPTKSYHELPLSRYFPNMEAAIFRSGWTKEDIVFYMRCGPPAGHVRTIKKLKPDQHNHPDANGFTLFFNNDYLAAEDGHKPQTGPDQHKIITYGHNTILVDGRGQKGDGGKRVGTTTSNMDYLDAEHVGYLLGDASSAYENLDHFYRFAIYKKHKYVVVVDELRDDVNHKYEFLLGTDRHHVLKSGKDKTFYAEPIQGSARLPIVFVEPQNIKTSIKTERPQVFGTATVDLLRVATTRRVPETNFFALLYPLKKNQGDPSFTKIYQGARSGILVDRDEYWLYNQNHGTSYSFGSVTTDARLCYFKDDSSAFEYLAAGTTHFLFRDLFGIRSEKPLVAAFKGPRGKIRLGKNLGQQGENLITLVYPGIAGVVVDGQLVAPEVIAADSITFRLSPKQYQIGPSGFEQTVTDNYEVEILTTPQQPFLRVSSPNGGEAWEGQSTQAITWVSNLSARTVSLEYSQDEGLSWQLIDDQTVNDGEFDWRLPKILSRQSLIRISESGSGLSDTSDRTFSITPVETKGPTITHFAPDSARVGAPVTLFGTQLDSAHTVMFSGMIARFEITAVDKIVVTVPDGARSGEITVITPAGEVTTKSAFVVIEGPAGPPQIGQIEFLPTDDTSAWEKKPTRSYGGWEDLRVRRTDKAQAISYFKFAVSGLFGEVKRATLNFLVTDGSSSESSVFVVANKLRNSERLWTESGLNWNNRPLPQGDSISSLGQAAAGDMIEFDVSGAVTDNGIVSFAVVNTSADALMLSSKEGLQSPRLFVETAMVEQAISKTSRSSPQPELELAHVKKIPDTLQFFRNYPNPFNPVTTFEYALPEAGSISLVVFDLLARKVRTVVDQEQVEGEHTARWDGRDSFGRPVSSGVYFVRLKAGKSVITRKVLLQK